MLELDLYALLLGVAEQLMRLQMLLVEKVEELKESKEYRSYIEHRLYKDSSEYGGSPIDDREYYKDSYTKCFIDSKEEHFKDYCEYTQDIDSNNTSDYSSNYRTLSIQDIDEDN